jgi:hypothetical protein
MRRFLGTALALGLVAALTWQVGLAQTNVGEGVVLCTRASADVRTPSANGSCPSGYVKTTVARGPAFTRDVGGRLDVFYFSTSNVHHDLHYQIIAASPDGTIRTETVQPEATQGQLGLFRFEDPVIGTYAFGIRVLGPLTETSGTLAPLQINTSRSLDGQEASISQQVVELGTTGSDILWTIPFVYTADPVPPIS